MAEPNVVSSIRYGNVTTHPHTITLPSSLAAGNLLLLVYAAGADAAQPSGWTGLGTRNGSGVRMGVFARVSDGTETTVTLNTGGTGQLAASVYNISDWYGSIAEGIFVGTNATGLSNSANPPSMSHTAGAVQTLFVACAGQSLANVTVTAWPSGYSNTLGSSGKCFTGTKNATSDTEDAGPFTFSVSFGNWSAFTIAVLGSSARPVQSGGSSTVIITTGGAMPDVVINGDSQTVTDWPTAIYGEPQVVRNATLVYLVSANPMPSWAQSPSGGDGDGYLLVYDGGVPLERESDYATAAEMVAEENYPSPGCFRAHFATDGTYIRLGSTPVFDLRCNAVGATADGMAWSSSDLLSEAGVTADTNGQLFVNARYVGDTGVTYLDVLNDSAQAGPYSFGFNRQGEFEVVLFAEPTGTPVLTFTKNGPNTWTRLSRQMPQDASVPVTRVTINVGEIWPAPTAGSADAAIKATLSKTGGPVFSAVAENDAVLTKHVLAATETVDIRDRAFDETIEADEFGARYMALFGEEREQLVLEARLNADLLTLDLNDVVEVVHDRMGMTGGRLYRVIAQTFDLAAMRATFTLWG